MDLVKLMERIHHEEIQLQNESKSIRQLNSNVNDEIVSTIKSMWIIKNQRYICDKLNVRNQNDPIDLINELNKIQHTDFILGDRKFGCKEINLYAMLQYLKDNPKSISYLLFYAEKECNQFLDLLCKIIISTIYNHCFEDQDKLSLIDIMEELIEIYMNFYDDLRRHLHNENSFGIVYRYFCDGLSELKTFYKLALTKPIMLVLSEDNLFLDIDSNRAVMRFCQKEREKHFGLQKSAEYQENLNRYQKWIIQKLKYFISHFIKSLKENIYAFPQSLVLLMIRMYIKLIEHFESQKLNAIFVDMLFFFLLCPAIQNPDLFGITDLHINHIARYNLMQCAQIIQMLALSNWEKVNIPHQLCDQFDSNCLSFIIDHIFSMAQNNSIPKSINQSPIQSSYFLIFDNELKFFLEFISLFLKQMDQLDNPLGKYFSELSESVLNFESVKLEQPNIRNIRKSKSDDIPEEFSSSNIKILLANNSGNYLTTFKLLFSSKQTFMIRNYNFQVQFVGLKDEKKLLNNITDTHLIQNETIDKIFNEIDELVGLEINIQKPSIEKCITIDKMANNIPVSFGRLNDNDNNNNNNNINNINNTLDNVLDNEAFNDVPTKQFNCDESEGKSDFLNNYTSSSNKLTTNKPTTNQIDEYFVETDMQSLGTLTLHLGDFNDDTLLDENFHRSNSLNSQELIDKQLTKSMELMLNQTTIKNNPMGKKVLFGIKNIKDKMKNISLKDSKLRGVNEIKSTDYSNITNTQLRNISSENNKIDLETVKAETDEIFGKYRSKNSIACQNNNIDSLNEKNEFTDEQEHQVDYSFDLRSKLEQLICTIDMSYIYRHYQFLNLSCKNDFILFLKILSHSKEISTTILIMDILRVMQDLTQEEFINIFKMIEMNWKIKNFYIVYLLKSRKYLLQTSEQIQSIKSLLEKEHSSTNFMMISFLVSFILEKRESDVQELITKFRDPSTLTDEKASLVKTLVDGIINNLHKHFLTDEQLNLVRRILERNLMNRIYLYAFYPNGDIDNMRDQILHQQINQLSSSINHNSKLLNIPSKYFTTSPWPSAQAELLLLSAYKTPADKVQCVYRCCLHIITLLSTSQNSIPSADDLLPVLIFVVIKANVKSILSTIQYVNSFYSNDMTGEESYYWTQFCSAVEFIKTILNEKQY